MSKTRNSSRNPDDANAGAFLDALLLANEAILGFGSITKYDLAPLTSWPTGQQSEFMSELLSRLEDANAKMAAVWPNRYMRPTKAARAAGLDSLERQDIILRLLFQWITEEKKWSIDLTNLERILSLCTSTGTLAHLDSDAFVESIVQHGDKFKPSEAARIAIARIVSGGWLPEVKSDNPKITGRAQLISFLQRLIGNAPLDLDPLFPADALVLQELGTDAPAGWLRLLEHCIARPPKRSNRKWLDSAKTLLEDVPADEFEDRAVRWLGALTKRISGPLASGDWGIPEAQECWLSGFALCASQRASKRILGVLGRACVTCLRPYETKQRSRMLALVCVDAIAASGHPAAKAELQKLKAKVKHKVLLQEIDKAIKLLK
jgi:hypothetical protein